MARRIQITGHVQGVFFRAWAKEQADELGIDGWVRNRSDGSVEALIAGDPDAVEAMIERLRRGPPGARVERLSDEPSDELLNHEFVVRQ